MKTLFLSHCPHEVHLEFAKSIGAKIKITHLNWFVLLYKKIPLISYFYPSLSFLYSLFISSQEDILLVDGGSSLYLAAFLKLRNPKIKIIYLDGDMIFYYLNKQSTLTDNFRLSFFFRKIDGIISVSEQNKKLALKYVNVPVEVVNPYPKQIKKIDIKRKNYGLYVGRLDPDKDIKRILGFGLQCPYFEKFIIVGDGAYKGYIKRISKQNKKIIYMGQRKDVDKFYNESKFLIHIPDYDPHPCTTMEAAMCGCFPIISAGTGTNYLFDKMFIVEDSNNFNEINEKIKNILDNAGKARKLLKQSVKKFPTKEKAIKIFENSFNKITNNKK